MSSLVRPAQVLSIATAFMGSGGIATLSLFDVPEIQSQPASRSLPVTRWLFSRGSHIFPSMAFASSFGFTFLAYTALSPAARAKGLIGAVLQLLKLTANSFRVNSYLAAAALTLGIAPVTSFMIPTNFRLIEMNEKLGGSRSHKTADQRSNNQDGQQAQTAEESVDGKGQPSQWTDLSGPQSKTEKESTEAEDREVRELLGRFSTLNGLRSVFMAAGGVAGLLAALA